MKFTYSWLKEHLETEASPQEIADRLTSLGLVIDSLSNPASGLENLIIAELKSVTPHPNADRLKVCEALIDPQEQILAQVVCGDPKVQKGMRVVMAKPGQLIPFNGMIIRESEVRGVKSQGMFCSAQELLLEEQSDGIISLPKDAPIGAAYVSYAHLDDVVFDMEVTPNRGDCLGIYGIARDLAAAGLGTLKPMPLPEIETVEPAQTSVSVDGRSLDMCPLFYLREIRGVKNGSSPRWLSDKLRAIGLRPRNILVDITNYMTYTYGRPMHVFDADKIKGNLQVRLAHQGEEIKTLDDKNHILDDFMHVVADSEQAVAIAGIIGGADSGVCEETTNVLLESALFHPSFIAKTGRKLGILSDARYRFERGVDAAIIKDCMTLATKMILDLCGGTQHLLTKAGQDPTQNTTIFFDPKQIQYLGGLTLERAHILKILSALGCTLEDTGAALIKVTPPTWRHDICLEQDLVEEVCRIVGYDKIELEEAPKLEHNNARSPQTDALIEKRDIARRHLSARGLLEVNTWSFLDEKRAELFGGGAPNLVLKNPISQDLSVMRPELLAGLAIAASKNSARGYPSSRMFEVGSVYKDNIKDAQENRIAGVRSHMMVERNWLGGTREVSLFDAKADILSLLEAFDFDETQLQIKAHGPSWYHPGRVGSLYLGPKTCLGTFGELHPQVLEALEIDERVVGFELYLDALPSKKARSSKKALKISSLQPLYRDLAFVARHDVAAGDIVQAARKAAPEVLAVTIFDVYQGKGIPEGHQSIGICVTFEQMDKTLTDDEINALMDKVIITVGQNTGAELRS